MARSHPEGMSSCLLLQRGVIGYLSHDALQFLKRSLKKASRESKSKKRLLHYISEGSVVHFSEPLSLQRVPKVLPRRVSKYLVVRPHKCPESDDHWSKSFTQQTRKFWYVWSSSLHLFEKKKDISNSPEKSRSETWSRNHRSLLTIGRKAV
jgi:hypothetical protein